MTKLLTDALESISKLSEARQDEIARMLIDIAESDSSGDELRLTPEQVAEVEAAMVEDGPYASDADMAAFFACHKA